MPNKVVTPTGFFNCTDTIILNCPDNGTDGLNSHLSDGSLSPFLGLLKFNPVLDAGVPLQFVPLRRETLRNKRRIVIQSDYPVNPGEIRGTHFLVTLPIHQIRIHTNLQKEFGLLSHEFAGYGHT